MKYVDNEADGKSFVQIELNKDLIEKIRKIEDQEALEKKIKKYIYEIVLGYRKDIKFQID